jgi:hypothetical protein
MAHIPCEESKGDVGDSAFFSPVTAHDSISYTDATCCDKVASAMKFIELQIPTGQAEPDCQHTEEIIHSVVIE